MSKWTDYLDLQVLLQLYENSEQDLLDKHRPHHHASVKQTAKRFWMDWESHDRLAREIIHKMSRFTQEELDVIQAEDEDGVWEFFTAIGGEDEA